MSNLFQDRLNKIKDEFAHGSIEKAEQLCQHELDILPFSAQHILLLDVYSNILNAKGDIIQAIKAKEKQLNCIETFFGKNHLYSASVLHNLGLLHSQNREYAKALEYCEQAVAVLKNNLAKNDAKIADALVNLSMQYYELTRLDKAEALLYEALSIYLIAQGNNSFGASTCYNNLGRIYEQLEQTEKAVQFHAKAVDIRKIILGNHTETAFCLGNYAAALAENGQFKEAVAIFDEALSMYAELGLENSKAALTCFSNKQICVDALQNCS